MKKKINRKCYEILVEKKINKKKIKINKIMLSFVFYGVKMKFLMIFV